MSNGTDNLTGEHAEVPDRQQARCTSMIGQWMNTVAVASIDTQTKEAGNVSIHDWPMDGQSQQ